MRLKVSPRQEDDVLARLGDRTLGVDVTGSEIVAYFETPGLAAEAAAELARWLGDASGVAVEAVRDDRWVERFHEGLEPFGLGKRFTVYPSERPSRPEKIPLVLVPGRAFGTGEHPTTRLAAEQLELRVGTRERWLDVGCGSAILSMVAVHCGAGEVLAVDVDAEALLVAREVLAANGLSHAVRLVHGDLRAVEDDDDVHWDGAVANIEAGFFLADAGPLVAAVRVGGRIIASGILSEQVDACAAALVEAGAVEVYRELRDGWAVVTLCRVRRP